MTQSTQPGQQYYFVETRANFKEVTTTEEGFDTLDEVRDYLNSLGFPEWVVDSSIQNMGLDDPTWQIKISLIQTVTYEQAKQNV